MIGLITGMAMIAFIMSGGGIVVIGLAILGLIIRIF